MRIKGPAWKKYRCHGPMVAQMVVWENQALKKVRQAKSYDDPKDQMPAMACQRCGNVKILSLKNQRPVASTETPRKEHPSVTQ